MAINFSDPSRVYVMGSILDPLSSTRGQANPHLCTEKDLPEHPAYWCYVGDKTWTKFTHHDTIAYNAFLIGKAKSIKSRSRKKDKPINSTGLLDIK